MPGGVIHDERYAALRDALAPLEAHVNALIEAQQRPALLRILPALMHALRALKWRGSWHIEVDPLEL